MLPHHAWIGDRTWLKRRLGFTLIELLVVIAIIGVLVGLLFPAVQKVREAANRLTCDHNLKQLALAAHSYHDSFQVLPPGMDVQHIGCLVYLLPYLEQDALYRAYSFKGKKKDGSAANFFWEDPRNRPSRDDREPPVVPRPPAHYGCEGTIKNLLCPSAPTPERTTTALLTVNYSFCGSSHEMRDYNINGRPKTDDEPAEPTHGHVFSVAPGRVIMGRSNYLGCGGDYRGHNHHRRDEKENPNYEPYRGVFHYNSKVSLSQIFDGTSATLMFGEIAGGYIDWTRVPGAKIPNGWASPSWSAGFNYVTFGLCPDRRADQHNCDFSPEGKGLSFGTFGSLHEGNVIHFAFCDGSVRPLRPTIPTSVLLALGGYQDGVVLSLDD